MTLTSYYECVYCGTRLYEKEKNFESKKKTWRTRINGLHRVGEKIVVCSNCADDKVYERYGWLDRGGRLHACLPGEHELFAREHIGRGSYSLTDEGWCKLVDDEFYFFPRETSSFASSLIKLTVEQARYLKSHDFNDVYDCLTEGNVG